MAPISRNVVFEILDANDRLTGLVMRKATVESVVMSLGDKITGDVYYKDNNLALTMQEYIIYNRIKYVLVNPPTIVREGMVSDNSELKGMTKYSFVFYHPMYQLTNIPFNDVAVSGSQSRYLSEKKIFSWIGNPNGFIAKVNANLSGTQWVAVKSSRFPNDKEDELSDVLTFNNQTVGDALKVFYDTWGVPYVIDKVDVTESYYAQGKRFKIVFGLPSNEIYASEEDKQLNQPFIFRFGQDVGLKNNSRNPRNNKIITRISGYGAERNVPYGYPQIPWYGDERWEYTKYVNDDPMIDAGGVPHGTPASDAYPLYMGIVGGVYTKLIQHPFTRSFLMPSIYSQTVFNKVSPYVSGGSSNPNYNPNVTLVDYYDAIASQQYPYPNVINPQAPSYESHKFEDIYPELGTARIINAEPLNSNLQPADEWDDTMDDDGNYVQSYFQITLPPLSFDLYACAAITQEMEINMRSGACIGCTFPVEVDWDSYKANFYDEDGNFDPEIGTGHPRDPQKFPDSTSASIKIIVKKENSTFGTLMPNRYQKPAYNDEFVVLGISLPQSYITNAEQRLDEEMKSYMLENNVYYFDYPLKFDEYWLENHEYVLSQIRPNSIIRFEYAGEQLSLYVKQMAIKYGENILPQYDITLTDNVDVVLNQVGRVAEDVEKLTSLISIIRENYNKSVWSEVAKKLSKVDDDTASGFIRFMKGLQVGSRFVSGLLGEGGVFRKDADGRTYLEVDEMYVRMKAYFDTVEIREYQHSHGGRVASSAGMKVSHVVQYGHYEDQQAGIDEDVPLDDSGNYHLVDPDTGQETLVPLATKFYRCYYRAKDGDNTTQNSFKVGDLARCHTVNAAQGLSMKDYWRAVVGTNAYNTFYNDEYGWTDLSNLAEVTLSHPHEANNKTIVGYMDGSSIPEQGDDLFQLGNIFEQGRRGAIMENTTGPNTPSYQVFQDIGLDSRSDQSTPFDPYTTTGKNYIDLGYDSGTGHAKLNVIGDAYIGDANRNTYVEYLQDDGTGQPKLTIKAIIDIASTLGNTNNTFQDLLNTIAGLGISIEDLQNQIDGAIETWFYDYLPVDPTSQTPTEPLINVVVEGQTVHCEPYYDWYTTDVAAGNNNERLKHLGDIFYDNSSGRAFRFSNSAATPSDPPHFIWVEIEDSAVIEALQKALEALGLADSKGKIYTTANNVLPPPPYNVNDLWVNASGTFTYTDGGQQMSVTYSNDILKCIHARTSSESASITDWTLASKYTDDTMVEYYTNILTGVTQPSQSSEKEISLAAQNAIRNALGGKTILAGGLMLTSLIGLRQLTPNANPDLASSYITWAGISGEYIDRVTPDAQDPTAPYAKGHGIAAWYGGNMVDKEMLSDAQIADGWDGSTYHLRWAKSVDRFDGSGYRADGNITWDAQGRVAIKDITTLIGENDTDLLNALTTFNNAFHFQTQQGSTTVLGITPQAGFTELNILDGGVLKPVATQEWVRNNYVEKTFFARLFQAYDANGVAIAPNEADDTTHIVNNIKAMVGFWTNQYLSALGQNPSQGGGGGGTGDVTWTALANPATGTPPHTIHESYIASILNNYVTFTQMQAQGYITSAALAGYATQSWVQQQGYVTSSGVTSVAMTVPTGFSVTPTTAITGTGTFAITFATGYSLPTTASQSNWDTAYTYSHSHSNKSVLDGITSTKVSTWDSALTSASMSILTDVTLGTLASDDLLVYDSTSPAHWKNVAKSTFLSSGISGTFWGQSWTNGGTVSGTLTNVLDVYLTGIVMLGHGSSGIYFERNSLNWHSNNSYLSSLMTFASNSIQLNQNVTMASGKTIKIGDAYLAWDSQHNAVKVYKLDSSDNEIAVNLYATGGVSALGYGSSGSGGGSGDVTWTALQNQATDNHTIHASYISSTLASYAQQSWVTSNYYISNGTIYMNGQSISPSLGNYLPLSAGASYPLTGDLYISPYERIAITSGTAPTGHDFSALTGAISFCIFTTRTDNDPSAFILNGDTAIIYNAFDTGWGFQVHDEDLANGQSNVFNGDTIAFGVNSSYMAWARGGFVKNGSNNDYVLLGGGGHAAISSLSVSYAASAGSATNSTNATNATTALTLYTNDSSQDADNCYDGNAGLHFFRTNGTGIGNDGFILQWSWAVGSVGQQLFLDDNPTGVMKIRGYNNETQTFGNWYLIYTDAYHPSADYASSAGNAATATNALILSYHALIGYRSDFDNFTNVAGFKVALFQNKGTDAEGTSLINLPFVDGTLVSFPWGGDNRYGAQLIVEDAGTTNHLAVRCRTGQANTWGGWAMVLTSANYNLYSPKLDGTGATGTWGITALKATQDGDGNTISSTYLKLTGGTVTGKVVFQGVVDGYNYGMAGANAAAFIFDKPNSYRTGIGAHSSGDLIWFGACDADGNWIDTYKQIWNFNGTIKQDGNAVIDSGNIGSQSVNYASSAGAVSWSNVTSKPAALGGSTTPVYWDGSGFIACTAYANASVNYATSAGNADTCDGLHVHDGRNNEVNKIVRTDSNGYIQCGYINSSNGDEANNSSPARVWGTNGSDSYLRTYLTSALSVNYAAYAGQLQTARSIWGNSFNGTADITGELKAYSRARFGYGAGGSVINADSYAMFVGTNQTRTAVSGYYIAGIAFNHMILYGNVDGYLYHPQGWIGLRLYDTPGSERSSLVFATKETTDGDPVTDHPVERMCIDPFGNVGIGTTSPSYKLHVNGTGYFNYNLYTGGMVGVGTTNPSYNLDVTGTIHSSSNIIAGGYVQIGSIRIVYDSNSNALKIIKSDDTAANLYATGGISALGANTSGGGGNVGDVTWTALAGTATNNRSIHLSYLTSALSGYATQAWVNSCNFAVSNYNTSSIECKDIRINDNIDLGGRLNASGDVITEDNMSADGTITTYSGFVNASDARKKDVLDYDANIDVYTLAYAPAIHFKWNNKPDYNVHVGTIAQYWQGVMPEVVTTDKNGYLSMQYDVLALLAAISVAKKVVDHERRIMELEEENAYLRYEINQLKKVA